MATYEQSPPNPSNGMSRRLFQPLRMSTSAAVAGGSFCKWINIIDPVHCLVPCCHILVFLVLITSLKRCPISFYLVLFFCNQTDPFNNLGRSVQQRHLPQIRTAFQHGATLLSTLLRSASQAITILVPTLDTAAEHMACANNIISGFFKKVFVNYWDL